MSLLDKPFCDRRRRPSLGTSKIVFTSMGYWLPVTEPHLVGDHQSVAQNCRAFFGQSPSDPPSKIDPPVSPLDLPPSLASPLQKCHLTLPHPREPEFSFPVNQMTEWSKPILIGVSTNGGQRAREKGSYICFSILFFFFLSSQVLTLSPCFYVFMKLNQTGDRFLIHGCCSFLFEFGRLMIIRLDFSVFGSFLILISLSLCQRCFENLVLFIQTRNAILL